MARRRPNAFEVSFREEAPGASVQELRSSSVASNVSAGSLKRKGESHPEDNRVSSSAWSPLWIDGLFTLTHMLWIGRKKLKAAAAQT